MTAVPGNELALEAGAAAASRRRARPARIRALLLRLLWPPERDRARDRAVLARPYEEPWADWDRLMDGRLHRLVWRRHYRGSAEGILAAAAEVARERGKAVKANEDKTMKGGVVWMQFADAEVAIGEPCPCGHRVLHRTHEWFARCESCGARLILLNPNAKGKGKGKPAPPPQPALSLVADGEAEEETAAPAEPVKLSRKLKVTAGIIQAEEVAHKVERTPAEATSLDAYVDVELSDHDRDEGRERRIGYGRTVDGERVLLVVEYPLDSGGERIPDPEAPGGYVHRVAAVPADAFVPVAGGGAAGSAPPADE